MVFQKLRNQCVPLLQRLMIKPSKDAILSVAKKFEDTHLRALHVFAEVNESIDQANKLAKGLTRERFTHRTWEFWLVLVVVLNFLCYAKCSV